MEYEELQRGYQYGMHRIYEMVVNTNPCYIYCLDSNALVDNVTVVAHALFHNDFFKNNIYFNPTSQNMMNKLANHGSRIRKYMKRWGKERVTEFMDHVIRIDTLIDPANAWLKKEIKDIIITDRRVFEHPVRLAVKAGHEYMDGYVNPDKWNEQQRERVRRNEAARELGIFSEPTKDIMGFLRDHAPTKSWQADILAMLYEESMYFSPQRMTKTLNEGWASYGDYNMMSRKGLCSLGQTTGDGAGIIDYAYHKMGVLGGKYSMNPYKLGYSLFMDIEDRWNKGRFGDEYDNCNDAQKRANWDTKANLGHEKVFEVRKCYDDVAALMEFSEDFCNKNEFFEWRHYPNGEWKIINRDYKSIKKKLIQRHLNGGLPEIQLVDPNYRGRGYMLLQHKWDGRVLYRNYVIPVMQSLRFLWNNDVFLSTRNRNDEEIVYSAFGSTEDEIVIEKREDFEKRISDGVKFVVGK